MRYANQLRMQVCQICGALAIDYAIINGAAICCTHITEQEGTCPICDGPSSVARFDGDGMDEHEVTFWLMTNCFTCGGPWCDNPDGAEGGEK